MKPQEVDQLFRILSAQRPKPRTELNYINPYTLLVAVVLSAQATDVAVNKATHALFAKVQTPQIMLDLGEVGLIRHIRTIGLFNTKAKNIISLSKILIEKYDGRVPDQRKELEALPGVGRKTANVVLNVAYGKSVIAVDTHIFRLSNRLGLAKGTTPEAVEQKLMTVVPKPWLKHAHHWLLLHGRYVCKARKPDCPNCSIRSLCQFKDKTHNSWHKSGS